MFKLADTLEERYETAKASVDRLPQSILAKAFRGELVPQDPNDEPAEALLERIRTQATTAIIKRICFMPATLRLTGSGVNAVGGIAFYFTRARCHAIALTSCSLMKRSLPSI